jgi:hypothetical protein
LLAGYHRRCARPKSSNILKGLSGGAPPLILPFNDRRNTLSSFGVVAQSRRFVLKPLVEICGSGIKLLNFGMVGKEVGEKPRRMRDLGERQTLRLH